MNALKSLAELRQVKQEIDRQASERLAEEVARREAEKKARAESDLFARSVGLVRPLKAQQRVHGSGGKPDPIPVQRQLDEQAVLHEALSDEWDVSSLLHTDEHLSFRRPGIGPDVVKKLRQGGWTVQAQLDLHTLRSDEARQALAHFIRESYKLGLRCVRVVHGKGLGSPGKVPVLKHKVHSWLIQKQQVIAYVQATPAQGGAGALVVLLQASGRS